MIERSKRVQYNLKDETKILLQVIKNLGGIFFPPKWGSNPESQGKRWITKWTQKGNSSCHMRMALSCGEKNDF